MSSLSPIGRVSYPNLWEPRCAPGSDKAQYSVTLLFEKGTDLSEMKEAANKAAKEKWGSKMPKKFESPFKDGNEKEGEEYQDMIYINFKASDRHPPGVVGPNAKKIDEKSGTLYPGCYGRVSYSVYAWEYMGKAGVSFGLRGFQVTGDGDPFDSREDAEKVFDAVATSADDSDPFGGNSDDVPF